MGEYADMLIDGDVCELCGEYLGEGDGFPQRCDDCDHQAVTVEVEKAAKQK